MGVNIKDLVEIQEITFEDLKGRSIAIDAYNTLYQFLSSIRDRFTGEPLKDSKGQVTSHLSGIFYRTSRILEAGITPVFVFDGKPPDFKKFTQEARSKIRTEAALKWKEALKAGDHEAVRRYSQQASRLTKEMIEEAKRLLKAMGLSVVQAPSEGEAQASYYVKHGQVWAVGSSDFDSFLFGADRLVRNLTVSGRKKLPRKETYVAIKPELMELETILKKLEISHDQLILLGILIGTDYAPSGAKGIGPKNALKLVKEKSIPEKVFADVTWEGETPPEKIYEFFKNPPVEDLPIEKERFQEEEIKKILIDEHDFSEDRIMSTLRKLTKTEGDRAQKGLGSFFGK